MSPAKLPTLGKKSMSIIGGTGRNIMQMKSTTFADDQNQTFPTDQQIKDFLFMLNSITIGEMISKFKEKNEGTLLSSCTWPQFRNVMNDVFEERKPSTVFLECLFERFKDSYNTEEDPKVVTLDVVIALILLARLVHDTKIELIFKASDDNDSGYLTPDQIEQMIILIEKIFAKEALNFEHPSPDLVFFKAEKRGA